jgi:hypothetical protein
MFDTTVEIAIRARTSAGKQEILVRWPSDQEWYERARRRKIVISRLGRGISETSIDPGDSDLLLFEKIKQNGAPALTAGEAGRVLDVIAQCDITDCRLEGDEAVVSLQIMGGQPVTHRLQLPSADQVLALRRTVRVLDLPYNKQELRIPLEPGARLWDACHGSSQDYQGAVPALHKDTAVRAVIDYLDREASATNEESSF